MARSADIAANLRHKIETGEYRPGDRLPGYTELTAAYATSKETIASALRKLQEEGLITVTKKRGTYVRVQGSRRRVERGRLVTRAKGGGYVFPAAAHADEKWDTHGQPKASVVPVPADVAEFLGVDADSPVVRRRRVTSPPGEPPFQIADSWIHPDAVAEAPQAAEPQAGPGGYLDRLEEAGHGPISWTEVSRIRMPSSEEARLLDTPATMPVLVVFRVGTSARTEQPVEVTVCVIPGDRVELINELRRAKSAGWPPPPPEE
jgi:DNA-binding GntR family transcriptional regulator